MVLGKLGGNQTATIGKASAPEVSPGARTSHDEATLRRVGVPPRRQEGPSLLARPNIVTIHLV